MKIIKTLEPYKSENSREVFPIEIRSGSHRWVSTDIKPIHINDIQSFKYIRIENRIVKYIKNNSLKNIVNLGCEEISEFGQENPDYIVYTTFGKDAKKLCIPEVIKNICIKLKPKISSSEDSQTESVPKDSQSQPEVASKDSQTESAPRQLQPLVASKDSQTLSAPKYWKIDPGNGVAYKWEDGITYSQIVPNRIMMFQGLFIIPPIPMEEGEEFTISYDAGFLPENTAFVYPNFPLKFDDTDGQMHAYYCGCFGRMYVEDSYPLLPDNFFDMNNTYKYVYRKLYKEDMLKIIDREFYPKEISKFISSSQEDVENVLNIRVSEQRDNKKYKSYIRDAIKNFPYQHKDYPQDGLTYLTDPPQMNVTIVKDDLDKVRKWCKNTKLDIMEVSNKTITVYPEENINEAYNDLCDELREYTRIKSECECSQEQKLRRIYSIISEPF